MSDLISKQVLLYALDYKKFIDGESIDINELKSLIKRIPTIEPEPIKHGKRKIVNIRSYHGSLYAPRKHGRWELVEDDFVGLTAKCSVCGKKTHNAVSWDFKGNEYRYHYCPNCGAKMVEVTE